MAETSAKQAPNNGKGRPFGSKDKMPRANQRALLEARKLQQVAFNLALEPGEGAKLSDVALLIRAWDVLEDRKRVLRGQPSPGSLKPESPKARRSIPAPIIPPDKESLSQG